MIPNPPVKRKKLKVSGNASATWICTDESATLATLGTEVFTWDGSSRCFGSLNSGTYEVCDPEGNNTETIYIDGESKITTEVGEG